MTFLEELRSPAFLEELRSPRVLWASVAWFGLGVVAYMLNGFWAYMTLPLFAVAGAWRRTRRRRSSLHRDKGLNVERSVAAD